MAIEPADALELEVRIAASAQTVFKFLTDPGEITRWVGTSATLDPRPGGVYRVNVTGRDIARGEFLEVTTFSRVVFIWGWEGQGSVVAPGSSTVEVSLAARPRIRSWRRKPPRKNLLTVIWTLSWSN